MYRAATLALVASLSLACASAPPPKLAEGPRSILVVPPVDETRSTQAARIYGATLTRALVDRGYYVFPSSVVTPVLGRLKIDASTEGALERLEKVFGADAILVTRIRSFAPKMEVSCSLLEAHSGREIWHGEIAAEGAAESALESIALGANARAFANLPLGPQHSRTK
ncbi:MAG: DUF799 family lipoprotein [Myxococcota bacterium]